MNAPSLGNSVEHRMPTVLTELTADHEVQGGEMTRTALVSIEHLRGGSRT